MLFSFPKGKAGMGMVLLSMRWVNTIPTQTLPLKGRAALIRTSP
jgi:hypothetical protein